MKYLQKLILEAEINIKVNKYIKKSIIISYGLLQFIIGLFTKL